MYVLRTCLKCFCVFLSFVFAVYVHLYLRVAFIKINWSTHRSTFVLPLITPSNPKSFSMSSCWGSNVIQNMIIISSKIFTEMKITKRSYFFFPFGYFNCHTKMWGNIFVLSPIIYNRVKIPCGVRSWKTWLFSPKLGHVIKDSKIVLTANRAQAHTNVFQYIIPHDDVIKWKHFPRYWPFVRGIHRSPVNSPHKGQWRGALMFSLICVWIND